MIPQSLMMKIIGAAFASLLALFAILLLLMMRRLILLHLERPSIHRAIPALQHLLSPPNASSRDLLTSRALPNARLIKAFALTNTFVSCEVDIHTAFVGRAMFLLKSVTERGWVHFQNIAVDSVEEALSHADEKDFDIFVQDVTMRVALVAILGIDVSVGELDSEDIHIVSMLITLLWSLSKQPDPIPADLLPRLNRHLRRLIPDEIAYPNPLDFVIPVWETMWRVIATSVAYAQNFSYIFSELHCSPTMDQFRHFDGTHPSVEWFITEVMRLHPPSKRIARASLIHPFPAFLPLSFDKLTAKLFGPLLRRECADIGSVLRSKCIWGADADVFEPLRFHSNRLTRDQEMIKSLPFGCGRYKCVAANWAPMAAGIISAAILDRVQSGSDFRLVTGKSIGDREGWSGWSVVAEAAKSLSSRNSEST
ncbi:hypothetical protein C0989_009357 [Termitomyces sp. Mn162]|nr:hypothetical protein C0989_009357 [Termitomyces sp. Mn162]